MQNGLPGLRGSAKRPLRSKNDAGHQGGLSDKDGGEEPEGSPLERLALGQRSSEEGITRPRGKQRGPKPASVVSDCAYLLTFVGGNGGRKASGDQWVGLNPVEG